MRMVRQLGREDWVLAGLEALASGGPGAVRVEATARRLGVSKGSFYWHFQGRADWRDALLCYWEHLAFAAMVRGPRNRHDPAPVSGVVGMWPLHFASPDRPAVRPVRAARQGQPSGGLDPERLEGAILLWARDDAWVARAAARVMAERRRMSLDRAARVAVAA